MFPCPWCFGPATCLQGQRSGWDGAESDWANGLWRVKDNLHSYEGLHNRARLGQWSWNFEWPDLHLCCWHWRPCSSWGEENCPVFSCLIVLHLSVVQKLHASHGLEIYILQASVHNETWQALGAACHDWGNPPHFMLLNCIDCDYHVMMMDYLQCVKHYVKVWTGIDSLVEGQTDLNSLKLVK